ncbi:MAG TPA: Pr6Pr family membrane protein [Steroidobacteraceae bacterium]
MTFHRAWGVVRLMLATLVLVAIGYQLAIQIRLDQSVLNFFSYFTNLSNLFAAVVLLLGGQRLLKSRGTLDLDAQVRALSAVNMTVVGIVFVALLRNVDLGSLLPWINVVLHYLMPCAVVLDWLLQPPQVKLGTKHVLFCLIFPALYLIYVLIRGAAVDWYPYPFLNPANVGGYGAVAPYAVGIAVTFLLAGWALIAVGNRLESQGSQDSPARPAPL